VYIVFFYLASKIILSQNIKKYEEIDPYNYNRKMRCNKKRPYSLHGP